jgi:hypothetical protein
VVGHRDGPHAGALALAEQIPEPGRAVEHRVLGVHVQVHELLAAARRRVLLADCCRVPGRGCCHEVPPPSGMLPSADLIARTAAGGGSRAGPAPVSENVSAFGGEQFEGAGQVG